uniref:Mediator of RNA polymerase II transcription subunit 9 n=1 Tax=Panagrellus redivivus TaxID=6233 RepID=A0A7E4VWI3_PANRE
MVERRTKGSKQSAPGRARSSRRRRGRGKDSYDSVFVIGVQSAHAALGFLCSTSISRKRDRTRRSSFDGFFQLLSSLPLFLPCPRPLHLPRLQPQWMSETEYCSPEECLNLVQSIEQGVRELLATIKSGQFADVRARISQLQALSTNFKTKVEQLPNLKRTPEQQQREIQNLACKINARDNAIKYIDDQIESILKAKQEIHHD